MELEEGVESEQQQQLQMAEVEETHLQKRKHHYCLKEREDLWRSHVTFSP